MSPVSLASNGYRLGRATLHRLDSDDGWALASHLALNGLITLFPFLVFVASLAGFFGEAALADRVASYLFDVWPAQIAEPIAQEVHNVLTRPRAGVLTVSIVVTLYLASNGVEALRLVLNRAYRTRNMRSFVIVRLQSILFVLVGAVATLALGILGVLGPILFDAMEKEVPGLAAFRNEFALLRLAITTILVVLALASAHLYLPGQRPRFTHILPGLLLTLGLAWAATFGFSFYLTYYADYRTTYAGLASVVSAIIFLYVISLTLVIGAEFNGVLADRRRLAQADED